MKSQDRTCRVEGLVHDILTHYANISLLKDLSPSRNVNSAFESLVQTCSQTPEEAVVDEVCTRDRCWLSVKINSAGLGASQARPNHSSPASALFSGRVFVGEPLDA